MTSIGSLKPAPQAPSAPAAAKPIVMVGLGDSLTAGTQDATTVQERQQHGYLKQIANQAGLQFGMPYIDGDGLPFSPWHEHALDTPRLLLHIGELALAVAPLAAYAYLLGAPPFIVPTWDLVQDIGHRTADSLNTPQNPQSDFAVSGFKLRDIVGIRGDKDVLNNVKSNLADVTAVGTEVPLVRAALGNGKDDSDGTEVQQALKRKPDLAVVWAGNNDALDAAMSGYIDDFDLTPVEDQRWTYQDTNPLTGTTTVKTTPYVMPGFRTQMVGKDGLLDQLLKGSNADIALINIPNVTVVSLLANVGQPVGKFPFKVLTVTGEDVTTAVEQFVVPSTIKGAGHGGRTEFPAGSKVSLVTMLEKLLVTGPPQNAADLRQRLTQAATSDGMLTEDDVLDPDELNTIDDRINQYNTILSQAAAQNPRIHLVDANGFLNNVQQNGHSLVGAGPAEEVRLGFTGTTDAAGRDGIFGYDGVHPSDTGQAIVANMLLDTLRQDLGNNPRFKSLTDAPPIDEKAVHAQDPHDQAPAAIVLDQAHLEQWKKGAHPGTIRPEPVQSLAPRPEPPIVGRPASPATSTPESDVALLPILDPAVASGLIMADMMPRLGASQQPHDGGTTPHLTTDTATSHAEVQYSFGPNGLASSGNVSAPTRATANTVEEQIAAETGGARLVGHFGSTTEDAHMTLNGRGVRVQGTMGGLPVDLEYSLAGAAAGFTPTAASAPWSSVHGTIGKTPYSATATLEPGDTNSLGRVQVVGTLGTMPVTRTYAVTQDPTTGNLILAGGGTIGGVAQSVRLEL